MGTPVTRTALGRSTDPIDEPRCQRRRRDLSTRLLVHPWLLVRGRKRRPGYAALRQRQQLTLDFPFDISAAATIFPRTKAYYVMVDSGRTSSRPIARGEYLLRPG
jgi:hypothetical protein